MNFYDINPFIRFAEQVFHPRLPKEPLFVQDCRILYVVSGKADIFIDSEHFELIPNSLFYCASGGIYLMQATKIKMIALNFDLTQKNNSHTTFYPRIRVSEGKSLPSIHKEIIEEPEFLNSYLYIKNAENCLNSIQKISEEFAVQKIFYQERGSALLKDLLVELYRHSIANTSHSGTTISKVMEYIQNNYNQPITNELLSSISGYHQYHLNRLFMKHVGTSVHKYVLNIRINEAKKLLLTTEQSLSSIAEQVGFNNNTHFSNYFKQVIGISPLKFRKQFKNKL